jgi:hypothetical protein
MIKRLLLIIALGAALAACSPAGGSASPDVLSSPDVVPSDAVPSMESVAPSP